MSYKSSSNPLILNDLSPSDEYIEKLLGVLEKQEELSPKVIAERTGLSLNATRKTVLKLESQGKVLVKRQQHKSPTMLVRLV